MRSLFFLLTLFAVTEATADDYQAQWESLHAGLLKESVDGDLDGALEIFEGLVGGLSASNETGPILAETLFQMGYGYVKRGDLDRARLKLRECVRVSNSNRCRHFLSKIALQENAIKSLPVRWDFDDREHRFVLLPGFGSTKVEASETKSNLRWTLPAGVNPDVLCIEMHETAPAPQRIRLEASLERGERVLYPVVEDRRGQRFTLRRGPLKLEAKPQTYEFSFRDFVGVDQSGITLDPTQVFRVEFHEQRSKETEDTGASVLFVHSFEML